MVVDSNLKAETLVGYVDRETIDQAVVDAIRASGGSLIKNPYFRQLDAICTSGEQQVKALAAARPRRPPSPRTSSACRASSRDMKNKTTRDQAAARSGASFHTAFKRYLGGTVGL